MHNLEELHYPIKKFELFQRPNVKVKILTFNDLLFFFSLVFIDIHWISIIPREQVVGEGNWKEREVRKNEKLESLKLEFSV